MARITIEVLTDDGIFERSINVLDTYVPDHVKMSTMDDQLKLEFFLDNISDLSVDDLKSTILSNKLAKNKMEDFDDADIISEMKARGYSVDKEIGDFDTEELADELENKGFLVLKPNNIIEEMELEQLKEKYTQWRNA